MGLISAGATFNDVPIPFPHVSVTGLAARSTLENLRREHPTATPIIVGGNGNSLRMLFDERRALSPEERMDYRERSLRGDGWSLHLAYERDLHDRQQRRLRELNAPEILIRDWEPPEAVNVAEVVNQTWPEPLYRPIDLRCAASSDMVLIVLIPTVQPWDVAAYLGFGGFNACPAPWVHVAYAREWSAQFGARLLSLTHDTLEFEVARPITSREGAVTMAAVHEHYCSDIADEWATWLRLEGLPDTTSSIVKHAAYLLGARLWQFWWD
jgi:hypothetical protein